MKLHVEDSDKKPYQAPQLVIYGDIRVITGAVGNNSATIDSTTGKNRRTA